MARIDFVNQLRELGYAPAVVDGGRVVFAYEVPAGRFKGKQIQLGFIVNDDFPINPPSGPHISPPLMPEHPSNDIPHPDGAVHPSDFGSLVGGTWQYWSRPYPYWSATDRSVRAYMKHIRILFSFD
jgi:hypothetical protein